MGRIRPVQSSQYKGASLLERTISKLTLAVNINKLIMFEQGRQKLSERNHKTRMTEGSHSITKLNN